MDKPITNKIDTPEATTPAETREIILVCPINVADPELDKIVGALCMAPPGGTAPVHDILNHWIAYKYPGGRLNARVDSNKNVRIYEVVLA